MSLMGMGPIGMSSNASVTHWHYFKSRCSVVQLIRLSCVPQPLKPPTRSASSIKPSLKLHGPSTSLKRVLCSAIASDDEVAPQLSEGEVAERIRKAVNFIRTSEKLVPYDSISTNLGLVIWQAIRDIPQQYRKELVSRLSSGDIRRLWKVAGQRYAAPPGAVAAAIGPEYSLYKDMPQDRATIIYWKGKASLPTHALGISSFTKAFFLGPSRDEEDSLYGRVIHPTPIANWVWPGPMYFSSCIGPSIVPITNEIADMTISYVDPDELQLDPGDIPRSAWPRPRKQRRPFDGRYIDYVRAAGPGVVVGLGYRSEKLGSGVPLVPTPLHFVMVKDAVEVLS